MERRENMTQWERNAVEVRDTYGAHVDWEDRFYECPTCGEPIYENDWSERELKQYFCPICCDHDWDDEEEDWVDEDEDFLDEDWEDEADETGFDPYMGEYSYDC